MISNIHVDNYINAYENGEILLNKERIELIHYIKTYVLTRDDIYFDEQKINNYISFSERWYFSLDNWEKFIAPFIFLYYKEDDELFYEEFFITLGRGGGKNGFISTLSNFFIGPLHGIKNYDVSVVANSEEQAKVSFREVFNTIDGNEKLEEYFDPWKAQIIGKATNSVFKYQTSNAKTKDGGREGCVIYDETHEYEDRQIIDVFSGGLGKVPNPREFFIGTNGFVRAGFYDKLEERCKAVLSGENLEDHIFPFICKLDSADEVNDVANWEKANPAFEKPLSPRSKRLFNKVKKQFDALKNNPAGRPAFMTKRMNLPEVDLEKVVAPWEEILATNRAMPNLKNKACIGGFDYASIKDFAAVGLLFRVGEDYIWKTHSFARKEYLDIANLKPPIKEWEEQGLLTIVDEPSIDPRHVVNWFVEMRKEYGIQKVIGDNFRMDLMRPLFEAEGFELEIVRNPRAAHSLLAPRIETMFANNRIIFGDNPLMRWYTNNVAVKIKPDGNKEYLKKDEHRRKTDGFQAFVHALWRADEVDTVDYSEALDFLNAIDF
ncbi:terminase TerL endonuclease subunit [Paenilisteria newyorkensis]|uniref:Terminase large subunit n=1 Tax=Listeria newyorkensis TaxID=1497681 RepID=A0A841YYT3_9LIST|nr:terminase TerL endonuclease subunit [Listeria newyorkensis]KGL46238.1 terminase [Listeriaceae bacterium FSL A5-0209]MBC1458468.1 terminase large subunit [Listeria newyorkensis]WAO22039.1 terminase large subunit [Listeria newyorkensis]